MLLCQCSAGVQTITRRTTSTTIARSFRPFQKHVSASTFFSTTPCNPHFSTAVERKEKGNITKPNNTRRPRTERGDARRQRRRQRQAEWSTKKALENYGKRENREQARTIIATWSAETVASKVQQLDHLHNNVFRSHRVDGAQLARMGVGDVMNFGLTRSEASTIHHDLVSLKIPWWKPIVDELNTIPNMITCSRMVATPFLGYIILQEEYTMACVGLAIFGFSDWLDGYIARTYNQTSVLGTFLDPFADKMLIMTLTGVCGFGGLLPLPLVGLILARDAGLIVGGFYLRGTTKPKDVPFFDTTQTSALEVKPSNLSKFNTASQVGLLMGALTNAACGFPGDDVVLGLCWLTGCTTFGSGLDYYINRPINAVDPASKQKGSGVD